MGASSAMVLKTPSILALVAQAERVDSRVPLVIRGDRGVGKDVLARLIHATSARHTYPFIKASCAIAAPGGCESELFGHERGASPEAIRRRPGGFEFANYGTIYLDQIGALPACLVTELARVLETGEVVRVGGGQTRRVDVRVIASTVDGAEAWEREGLWRELRRLNAVEICIPPLRYRAEEIPALASFFAERFNELYGQNVQLCADVIAELGARAWPGNVRELETTVRRFVADGIPAFVR